MTEPVTNQPIEFRPWDGKDAPSGRTGGVLHRNRKLLAILGVVVLGMFGFAFANVPLFQLVCEKLGIAQFDGSRLTPGEAVADGEPGRPIRVTWSGTVHGRLPVALRPAHPVQSTHLNELTVNDYVFTNLSDRTVYFKPIHTIQPTAASSEDMFILSECFCFEPQVLRPRETARMPVVYRLAPELPDRVAQVVVNYTLFEMTENDYLREINRKEGER